MGPGPEILNIDAFGQPINKCIIGKLFFPLIRKLTPDSKEIGFEQLRRVVSGREFPYGLSVKEKGISHNTPTSVYGHGTLGNQYRQLCKNTRYLPLNEIESNPRSSTWVQTPTEPIKTRFL